jgi:hypothetical protein
MSGWNRPEYAIMSASPTQNPLGSDNPLKGGDPCGLHTRAVLQRQRHSTTISMVQRKAHDKYTGGATRSNRPDDGRD